MVPVVDSVTPMPRCWVAAAITATSGIGSWLGQEAPYCTDGTTLPL